MKGDIRGMWPDSQAVRNHRMLSLSHGACRCVKFGTDKLNFGDGVTLSVGSSKSHFAFLKSFPHGIALILLWKISVAWLSFIIYYLLFKVINNSDPKWWLPDAKLQSADLGHN